MIYFSYNLKKKNDDSLFENLMITTYQFFYANFNEWYKC